MKRFGFRPKIEKGEKRLEKLANIINVTIQSADASESAKFRMVLKVRRGRVAKSACCCIMS